ncbi:MAG: hypothetical protein LBG15_08015 [Dysgonamonadaceae bacterium]|jgi:hypothetical protein|nr:hypothetical protein [Dysgonamonadaceae bacterium]
MKVLNVMVLTLMLMGSAMVSAQENTNFFAGKWDLLVEGTPDGDTHIFVNISSADDGLAGEMTKGETVQKVAIEQTKDDVITLKFEARNFEISINLEKKDENSVKGYMLDMFSVTGKRGVEKEGVNHP